jgi:hypothetical protein
MAEQEHNDNAPAAGALPHPAKRQSVFIERQFVTAGGTNRLFVHR